MEQSHLGLGQPPQALTKLPVHGQQRRLVAPKGGQRRRGQLQQLVLVSPQRLAGLRPGQLPGVIQAPGQVLRQPGCRRRLLQGGGQLCGRLREHHARPVQVVGARGDQPAELLGREGLGQRLHHADALDVGTPVAALRRRGDDAQLTQALQLLGRAPERSTSSSTDNSSMTRIVGRAWPPARPADAGCSRGPTPAAGAWSPAAAQRGRWERLEPPGWKPAGTLVPLAYIGWSLWLLALGIGLLVTPPGPAPPGQRS